MNINEFGFNMNKIRLVAIFFLSIQLFILGGCANIPRYSIVEIKPDSNNTIVLLPPSESLIGYDPGLAEHWYRSFNHNAQIQNALSTEIDARGKRIVTTKSILAAIGSILVLSNSIYTVTSDNPDKKVVGTLSILSGTSMITMLPAFTKDERLEVLKEKLIRIELFKNRSVSLFSDIETTLTILGMAETEVDPDRNPLFDDLTEEDIKTGYLNINNLHLEMAKKSKDLRKLLTDWANEAQ